MAEAQILFVAAEFFAEWPKNFTKCWQHCQNDLVVVDTEPRMEHPGSLLFLLLLMGDIAIRYNLQDYIRTHYRLLGKIRE
jgi:hypothetical protein